MMPIPALIIEVLYLLFLSRLFENVELSLRCLSLPELEVRGNQLPGGARWGVGPGPASLASATSTRGLGEPVRHGAVSTQKAQRQS